MGIFSPVTLTLSLESPLLHSQLIVLPFKCVTIIKHHELCGFDKSISHSFAKPRSAGLVPGDRKFFHGCYWSLSSPGEGPVSCFGTCFIRTVMARGKIYSNNLRAVPFGVGFSLIGGGGSTNTDRLPGKGLSSCSSTLSGVSTFSLISVLFYM